METTHGAGAESVSAAASHAAQDAQESIDRVKSVAVDEIKALIADVEELVTRISDLKDSDVVRVRERVMQAVDTAKETLADGTDALRKQARRAVSGADDYVHESPWAAVGLAALVGAVVGILVARRS